MLSARIDDLTQLVQDFAAQHEKHAAALQAQRPPRVAASSPGLA